MRLGRTVGELGREMSAAELGAWAEFDRRNPIGDERGDYQSALIAAALWELKRDRKKRREPFTPTDFLPRWGAANDKPKIDPAAVLAALRQTPKKD